MNIHTKKENEFVRKLLEVLKSKGIHIPKSRLTLFVNERAPSPMKPQEGWPGITLGRVNASIRLLWALSAYFAGDSLLRKNTVEERRAKWSKSSDIQKIYLLASQEMANLCAEALWLLMKERFDGKMDFKTHCFVLKSNWSIHAVALASVPPLPGRLEQVLSRIEGQLIVSYIATK